MINITIVGAGVYGSRIVSKYKKNNAVKIKAVVSRHKPKSELFLSVPFYNSAKAWQKDFGSPGKNDVFDICVHTNILVGILEEFAEIGGKNFILPKPIALNKKDLLKIQQLSSRHRLNILVASQWHYSKLVAEISDFVKKNKSEISAVEVTFSRSFELARKNTYTSATAFLPHILQILFSTGLITGKSEPIIENFSDKKLKIRYGGKINIRIESDLEAKKRTESLKIFLNKDIQPSLVANFSGVIGKEGFLTYPSITISKKKYQVCEDVLEKMIDSMLSYFNESASDKKYLTLDKYLPIANAEIRVVERAKKVIVVIGGGIFGILSALEISKKGYSVLLIEKASEIITGASLVNQCRVHMGYHYPRDEKTARDSRQAETAFRKLFNKAIVKNLNNHYLVAKEGSVTSPKDFIAFCKRMNLPYKESWPAETNLSKEKIALSLKVPEVIFDANTIRDILNNKIRRSPNITLLIKTEVVGVKKNSGGFEVKYKSGNMVQTTQCAAIVNATYGGLNYINKLAGLPLRSYQYELCEVPVVRTPWSKTGWAITDGPFFGIMPFGFSKNYIFYDVELSVLERVVGALPKFKFSIDYYNNKKRMAKRFSKYHKKWKSWFPDVEKCEQSFSLYATRIVLPKQERTDARPTVVEELSPGFWQIFSGKITMSVPQAIEIGESVDKFLSRQGGE